MDMVSLKYKIKVVGLIFLGAMCMQPAVLTAAVASINESIDLSDAWSMAVEADAQWLSEKASLTARQELLPQARAALLPTIGTNAQLFNTETNIRSTNSFVDNAGDFNRSQDFDGASTRYSLELRQPLLNLSALKLYKSAKKTIQIINYQFELAKQDLAIRLSQAYFNLLLAKESVSLADSELKAISRQLDQTQQRFKVGLVSKTDVLEAQAVADQARVAVALAQNQQAISKENLGIIIGQQNYSIRGLQSSVPLESQKKSIENWSDSVLAQNVRFKIAQLNETNAGLNRDATKASYWPTVDAVASYSNQNDYQEVSNTQYGLQATWTPFQGGGLRSRVREADLQYQSAMTDVAGLSRTLRRDARNLYMTIETNLVAIKARQQAIISSESALEATRAGYEVGTRNVVDVLNAQRSVFSAKRDFAEARFSWIQNKLESAYLDSSLSGDNLKQISQWMKK